MIMKKKRHEMILKLIKENEVATQDELLSMLISNGFSVTQATVSRDINELHLIKIQGKNGQKYAKSEQHSHNFNKFHLIFSQSVISVECAGNICCIKCFAGTANAAAATVDALNYKEVVGTLAGDDTLFVLLKTPEIAEDFKSKIEELLG